MHRCRASIYTGSGHKSSRKPCERVDRLHLIGLLMFLNFSHSSVQRAIPQSDPFDSGRLSHDLKSRQMHEKSFHSHHRHGRDLDSQTETGCCGFPDSLCDDIQRPIELGRRMRRVIARLAGRAISIPQPSFRGLLRPYPLVMASRPLYGTAFHQRPTRPLFGCTDWSSSGALHHQMMIMYNDTKPINLMTNDSRSVCSGLNTSSLITVQYPSHLPNEI